VTDTLQEEEQNLFLTTIGKVTPIKSDKHSLSSTKPEPYPKKNTEIIDSKGVLNSKSESSLHTVQAEESIQYTADGVQNKVLKKMRKGHYGLDAELDLHGLTSQQAKHELIKFLHFCLQDGLHCVRIIHGKGYRSEHNLPVLKNELNLWLRQHQEVQAFCSASQRDGGTGAVVVLLRLSSKYSEQNNAEY